MRSELPGAFERCIEENELFAPGQLLLLAVSGGADSMCMLALAAEYAQRHGLRLAAAHVNHGIRGEEAERDESFVRAQCAEFGVRLYSVRVDVPAEAAKRKLGIEECARELRYAFLEQTADELGADRILTAHNADDNAETVIMNLARGAGAAGLAGIAPRRGRIVRPLLYMTREEIEAELKRRGLPHVEDSTNSDTAYTRNRIRHEVMPRLRELNPAFSRAVLQSTALLRRDDAALNAQAADFIENCGQRLSVTVLQGLEPALRSRVLRGFAKRFSAEELTQAHTKAMERLVGSVEGSAELHLPGLVLRREYDTLTVGEEKSPVERIGLRPGHCVRMPGGKMSCEAGIMYEKIHSNLNIIHIKRAIIVGELVVRPREEGDRICLPGRPGKTLKKLFIEQHIPARERGSVPVIADDRGVLAVIGLGVDVRALAKPGDEILTIRFVGEDLYE